MLPIPLHAYSGADHRAQHWRGLEGGTLGHAIFISYRRDDSEGEAGRLFDDLARTYGDTCVFMDVAGIDPGADFRKVIEDNVVTCGVLLAVIGPSWVTIKNAA